jgi:hypothetical protein
MYGDAIKVHKEKISSIQAAVEEAFAEGLMRREAYDLICEAAVRKMRKNVWEDPLVAEEQCTPPSPPPEQVACSPLDEPEPEYPCEALPVEVYDDDVQSEPCCLDESTKAPTEQEEPTIEEVPEAIVDTNALYEDANTVQAEKSGFVFTWCLRCARVEVIQYGSKTLPTELRGAESQLDNGIAMIVCGRCRPRDAGNCRIKLVAAEKYGLVDDVDFRSSFEKLKLSPAIFEGSEVAKIARAIMSSEVAFVTVGGGGVAFKDINQIVKGLTAEDRLMSADVTRFREGERENLLLPYLAGGLTT